MQYRQLGKSGLKVSALSLGSWLTLGEKLNLNEAESCINYAFEQGINFFDTAEVYGNGHAELIMGETLKRFRREDVVVATKIFWSGEGPNDIGLSRKHLIEGTRNSLRRLQLDYVDLLFCHRPDPTTPIEETVRAMDYLVRSGQVFYWGTSEWSAEQIAAAYEIAERLSCIPPTTEQSQYNLFHRQRIEQEFAPLYHKFGMGVIAFSPLAFGLLSGKYNEGIPENSRLALYPEWRSPDMEQRLIKMKELASVVKLSGYTLAQLAIAWCLKNQDVSSVIVGASSLEQLNENLKALAIAEQLSSDILQQIERILG